LIFIEEAFERLLLDYDRVFSAMGVPACLWRRTGEIYKGSCEFSEFVGVNGYMMQDVSCLDVTMSVSTIPSVSLSLFHSIMFASCSMIPLCTGYDHMPYLP
ncbi:hypothetical protein F4604DRAFT_1594077, partial [Suillus subluteus]